MTDATPVEHSAQFRKRGKLKIFLGAAPGVGKTYKMLSEAHRRFERNHEDIVVGLIEAHGRPETLHMLEGLEHIPLKVINYRGKTFEELNTAAVIARRPEWVLVDELAHTNAPGAGHTKRWQSVEELLEAGINVISTVNVQHFESLKDKVFEITGVHVRETLPDSILDEADEVEFVDLPPDALINRLKRGDVFIGHAKIDTALTHFFKRDNISALRELALRKTADEVEESLQEVRETMRLQRKGTARDRVMVCLTLRPIAAKLVRRGSRLARRLDASLVCVFVQVTGASLNAKEEAMLQELEEMTRNLGGESVVLEGESPAKEIIRYAKEHQITFIVMGQSVRTRLEEIFRGSVITHVMRDTKNIDVLVVADSEGWRTGIEKVTRIIEEQAPVVMTGTTIAEHSTPYHKRGKHKIFLGAAPGVGKTYKMLSEAHRRFERNHEDIVIGFVESHGRIETARMAEGLEQIPRKFLNYRGTMLEEMDTAAVIARRPEYVLVDELAHTNAPGTVHAKRWQSVEELLDEGINVISTVNVQHFETLNDRVFEITGVRVRETLPDSILDEADEVEFVDLPADALINRLKRGNIYNLSKVPAALTHFFQKDNISALRELALRKTADEVEEHLEEERETQRSDKQGAARDRVMVCLTPRPDAAKLVRRGYVLSKRLGASFVCVFVKVTDDGLSAKEEAALQELSEMTRNLGGEVEVLEGKSPAVEIISYAKEHPVTFIVMGRSVRTRLEEILRGSVITNLMRETKNIDVLVVSDSEGGRTGADKGSGMMEE